MMNLKAIRAAVLLVLVLCSCETHKATPPPPDNKQRLEAFIAIIRAQAKQHPNAEPCFAVLAEMDSASTQLYLAAVSPRPRTCQLAEQQRGGK